MVGKIVKQITKDSTKLKNIFGDKVYPLYLPDTGKITYPSAIYAIQGAYPENKQIMGQYIYNIVVGFRILVESYAELDKAIETVVTEFTSHKYKKVYDGKQLNTVELMSSSDLYDEKDKLYGNNLLFNFKITI